jgi:hypothetical protein
MGWSFRRSVSFGPVRLNFSKSGVGYSVGGSGFRTGVRANGRRYTRMSIPGTGVSYTTGHGRLSSNPSASTGCLVLLVVSGGAIGIPIAWWFI